MRFIKRLLTVILILGIVWIAFLVTDYIQVFSRREMPVFCLPTITADDGGSGTYQGLGYRFEIEGEFLSAEGTPAGVTSAEMLLFGRSIHKT